MVFQLAAITVGQPPLKLPQGEALLAHSNGEKKPRRHGYDGLRTEHSSVVAGFGPESV